jgi:hypothetical protein
VRDVVWQEIGAYEFWTITKTKSRDFPIIGKSEADLSYTHEALQNSFLYFNMNHDDGQAFDPTLAVTVPLSEAQALEFSLSRKFGFTLDIHDFSPDWARVFVLSVDIEISGISTFSGKIVQFGRNVFRSSSKEIIEFQTLPLVRTIQSGHINPVSIAQTNGHFLGVSPFATWLLTVNESVDREALKRIRSIVLRFEGRYMTLI